MQFHSNRAAFDRAQSVEVHLAQVEEGAGVTLRGRQVEVVQSGLVPERTGGETKNKQSIEHLTQTRRTPNNYSLRTYFLSTPSPAKYIAPKLNCASAFPWSALLLNHFNASL
jgi:hypothetical protein